MTTSKSPIRYHGASDEHRLSLLSAVAWTDHNARQVPVEVGPSKNREGSRRVSLNLGDVSGFSFSGFNIGRRRPLMIIDVDSEYDHDRVSDLPVRPNWIGINRQNAHAQLTYVLDSPVFCDRDQATSSSMRFAQLTQRGLSLAVGGDPFFSNTWARNQVADPSASEYDFHFQHLGLHSVRELFDSLDEEIIAEQYQMARKSTGGRRLDLLSENTEVDGTVMRKMYMFDCVRHFAYPLRTQLDRSLTLNDLRPFAESINRQYGETHKKGPLTGVIVESTIRSVVRFCNSSNFQGRSWFTPAQQAAGGQTSGPVRGAINAADGTLERAREMAALVTSTNAVMNHAMIRIAKETTGLSTRKLAAELNVSHSTVQRALR